MIKIINLTSGIKLILDKMDSVKSVSIGIWCNTGSANEREEEHGISHLIEHMLFKGTKNRNSFEIVKEMDSMGAEINAFTSKEHTCFYAKCVDEYLYKSADILIDLIENPLFDEKELEKEKKVVIEEINMSEDEPDGVALDVFDKLILDGSSLAHPVLGSKESVMSFDSDKLKKYYREHYTKDSIVVSVAGSFDEEQLINYFDDKMLSLPDESIKDEFVLPKPIITKEIVNKATEQAYIISGLNTIPINDVRRYPMSLLSILFGGTMSSRLFQTVREKKGLAYSVFSSNSFYKKIGQFAIIAGVAKNRIDEYLEAIQLEIEKLSKNSIAIEEFEKALSQLKSSYFYSLESTLSRMKVNAKTFLSTGNIRNQDDMNAIFSKLKLSDIEDAKKLICDFNKYTTVIVAGE